MEGEEEEMERRRVRVERAPAEEEEMERRRVRAQRRLAAGYIEPYDLWVVGGYSRESLRRAGALGDGVGGTESAIYHSLCKSQVLLR
jgi:hypothetical protein